MSGPNVRGWASICDHPVRKGRKKMLLADMTATMIQQRMHRRIADEACVGDA